MSLDVDLMVTKPVSVFTQNITHNLNKMAMTVELSNGMTLYDVLWRPAHRPDARPLPTGLARDESHP